MERKRALCILLVVTAMLLTGVLAPGLQGMASTHPGTSGLESISIATGQIGPEFRISEPTSPEVNRYAPSVAYNSRHREYLVVWHNVWPDGRRDIYARRVSKSGALLSLFTISTGLTDRAQPAVAYDYLNDLYLVVWMYNASGDGSTYDIWCRTVAWDGSSMGPEKEVISWDNRSFWTPRVAFNGLRRQYLVVWTAMDTLSWKPTDVALALLDSGGNRLFGTIISSAYEPHQADVTYNIATDEYLVVWRRMWDPADGDIRAARIHGGNAVVIDPPGAFSIDAAVEDSLLPSVTTNQQHRYFVVWQHAFPGPCCDWDIRGQELDAQGGLVGDQTHIASSFDDELAPQVAARPGPKREYMAVWQRTTASGEAIWAHAWGDAGSTFYGDFASAAFWENESPAVAAGYSGFLAVYEGDAQGDPTVYRHIYGRRLAPFGLFLPIAVRDQ
jgi:hypothetical protein